jgi:hypothetical protein
VVLALAVYLTVQVQNGIAQRKEAERRRNAEVTGAITTGLLTAAPVLLRSTLLRDIGVPVGIAIASAVLLRKLRNNRPSD